MSLLLVGLGAAIGAPLRFVAGHYLDDDRFPTGTFVVNVAGSFLLGFFVALGFSGAPLAMLGAGFCGGLTTYSTFAVQTHRRGPRGGAVYAVITIVVALAACAAGFALG